MAKKHDDIFALPVHPLANVYAMLTDEDLDALAEDIKANGLNQPLIVQDGQLVDGRNRREACRRIGVVPTTVDLPSDKDIGAFILSQNSHRRHITQGQQAIAYALVYAVGQHGGVRTKGQKQDNSVVLRGFREQVRIARVVIEEFGKASEMVESVIKGGSLAQAYAYAQKQIAERKERATLFDYLRKDHPEIASHVDDHTWTLEQAVMAAKAVDAYKETQQEREKIHLEIEHLSEHPIVPTVPSADLSLTPKDIEKIVPTTSGAPIEHVKAQSAFLARLMGTTRALKELEASLPTHLTEESAAWAVAVRSALASSIDTINRIGNTINTLGSQSGIRRIK